MRNINASLLKGRFERNLNPPVRWLASRSLSASTTPFLWMEPIHVLGAGSIGLLVAASLRVAFPSYPVRILLREHCRVVNGTNVLVNLIQNRRLRTVEVPAQVISRQWTPKRNFRNILITTKAYQAVTALQSIQHCLKLDSNSSQSDNPRHTCNIVLLCNGALAVREDILSNFPKLRPQNLHCATTTHAAYRDSFVDHSDEESSHQESTVTEGSAPPMMTLVHAGIGQVDFPESLQAWTPLFDRAGLQAHSLSHQDMERKLWFKLAANCLINPLTALYQCSNGDVVKTPEWKEYLAAIPEEVARVAKAQLGAHFDAEASHLSHYCESVVAQTKENRSSMLQDVKAGRRTEIDALNGYIVRKGAEASLDVPANRDLYERILGLGWVDT